MLGLRREFNRLTAVGVREQDRAALLDWLEPYALSAALHDDRRDLEQHLLGEAKEADQLIAEGRRWIECVDRFNNDPQHVGVSLALNQAWPSLMAAQHALSSIPGKDRYTLDPRRPRPGRPRLPTPRNFETRVIERLETICPMSGWDEGAGARQRDLERLALKIAHTLGLETVPRGMKRP